MDTIKVGATFNIQVNIRGGKNVYGIEAHLVYPLNDIEILQKDGKPATLKGDFMGENSAFRPTLKQGTEYGFGVLEVLHSLKGNVPEKSGDGLLFTVKAKALTKGTHVLQWRANSTVTNKSQENEPSEFRKKMLEISSGDPDQPNIIYITVTVEDN